MMIDRLLKYPKFLEVCRGIEHIPLADRFIFLQRACRKIAPVCCFLGDSQMDELYLLTMPTTSVN